MERRKTKDFWAQLLFYLNIMAWILLFVILLVFHRAQPEFETFFDRFYRLDLRTDWDIRYLNYLIYINTAGILMSLSGIILGRFRGRRESDHKNILIITGVLSIALLSVALIVL